MINIIVDCRVNWLCWKHDVGTSSLFKKKKLTCYPHITEEEEEEEILTSHNNNTPTAGRRGATLSATYLGGHLTFTSNHRHADRQTRQTDRQNSNLVSSPSHYAIVI